MWVKYSKKKLQILLRFDAINGVYRSAIRLLLPFCRFTQLCFHCSIPPFSCLIIVRAANEFVIETPSLVTAILSPQALVAGLLFDTYIMQHKRQ